MRGVTIAILISVLIFALMATFMVGFVTNQINLTSKETKKAGANNETTSDPTQLSNDVKTQVDFKNIQTGLMIYYSETGYYPFSLDELQSSGSINDLDLANYVYQRCDADTVIVKLNNDGFRLDQTTVGTKLSC